MKPATMRLIEAVERLNMSGEVGDGMVATLHDLAAGARLEQTRRPSVIIHAPAGPIGSPPRSGTAVMIADGGRCRNCGCPR